MPPRLAAALFGAWMVALGVAFDLGSGWAVQTPVRLAAGLSTVIAINIGVRRHQPAQPFPWYLLAATIGLSSLGTAAYTAPPAVTGAISWLPAAGRAGMLLVYPLLAVVLMLFVHHRMGGGRDRGGRLDALTVTAGVTLLAWTFAIGPQVRGMDWTAADQWLVIAFPAGDLLCLAMLIRLLTTADRRRFGAAFLLSLGILAMITADVGYHLVNLRGDLEFLAALGRLPLYLAIGLAALHPSMTALTRVEGTQRTDLGRVRLLLLAAASLIAPAVLLAQFRYGGIRRSTPRTEGGTIDLSRATVSDP